MAYCSAIHDTTGCSPTKMMLGRELKLPIDLMFGRPEEELPQTATDYANALQKQLERVHDCVHAHLQVICSNVNSLKLEMLYGCTIIKEGKV